MNLSIDLVELKNLNSDVFPTMHAQKVCNKNVNFLKQPLICLKRSLVSLVNVYRDACPTSLSIAISHSYYHWYFCTFSVQFGKKCSLKILLSIRSHRTQLLRASNYNTSDQIQNSFSLKASIGFWSEPDQNSEFSLYDNRVLCQFCSVATSRW